MTNISQVFKFPERGRGRAFYCTICKRRITTVPFYRVSTSDRRIMESLGYYPERNNSKVLHLHLECFEKKREEIEKIEHEGYSEIPQDEWEEEMREYS
jgi:hypothetical protein